MTRALPALLACLIPVAAIAATHSQTLRITASVPPNCVLRSSAALDFGAFVWKPNSTTLDATANALTIACTRGAAGVAIALGNGQNHTGTYRGLSNGKNYVRYQVYTGADRSVVWDMVNTVQYVPSTSQAVEIPIYGRVVATQQPQPGAYTDVLLASVNF